MPADVLVLLVSAVLATSGLSAFVLSRRRPVNLAEAPVVRADAPIARQRTAPDETTTLDLLDVGVLRLDSELRVRWANPAAARLLGVSEGALKGRSLMATFLDHRVEEAAHTAAVAGSASIELGPRDPDERRLHVSLRRAEDGSLLVLLDDVSELRRLQRIRSEFIDNLSHEIRTPLTTIRLLTETLGQDLEHAEVPPRIRERVIKIDVETGHLVQMVNELLDLSRIEGGAAELHFESVNLAEVISGALDRLRTFADRQRIALTTELPEEPLPRVRADGERLGQVLVNLLHNAVKFSPEGTTVTVAAYPKDDMATIEVRDQGVGVPQADLNRIFERFYKVDKSRQRGQGGTGLGLAIARHIIEGQGGRIWAESEEGKGSAFIFTVPFAG